MIILIKKYQLYLDIHLSLDSGEYVFLLISFFIIIFSEILQVTGFWMERCTLIYTTWGMSTI